MYTPTSDDDFSQPINTQPVENTLGSNESNNSGIGFSQEEPIAWGFLECVTLDKIVYFTNTSYTIGRSKACDIVVPSTTVSGKHCCIFNDNNSTFLVDLKSSNGTYLKGSHDRLKADSRVRIRSGDKFNLVFPKEMPIEMGQGNNSNSFTVPNSDNFTAPPNRTTAQPQAFVFKFYTIVNKNPFAGPIRDKYEPICEIGKGTYATVWRAIHKISGRHVAIKIIEQKKFALNMPSLWDDQCSEASTLQKLNHPGIIKLYDIYQSTFALFLVMEYVNGGELFDRLVSREKPYDECDARDLTKNILEAVAYMHSKDIVHRDLKPENILLCFAESNVDIKLADFGFAKKESGGLGTFCGSLSYVAPEVLQRGMKMEGNKVIQRKYGKSADMWSIGVIVYMVLSRRQPFDEEEKFKMHNDVTQLLTFDGEEWDHVSKQAKDLIRALLVRDGAHRITAEDALNHEWFSETTALPSCLDMMQSPSPRLRYRGSLPPDSRPTTEQETYPGSKVRRTTDNPVPIFDASEKEPDEKRARMAID